ncbi:related to sexual differentiation process protein isp4 [Phialocephala subalpina]|uniref:Related to sexual differentiation process protein isp4 n=1 Tax=Phialocephala subalpina TaxID=576137 RepID=A0A1L7XT27_9HELO|nr:related to sexual differentiation process protein isp4 [Phialocephala subalpina]
MTTPHGRPTTIPLPRHHYAHNSIEGRDIPLSALPSTALHDSRHNQEEDEELDPDSDAALLRRHRRDSQDDADETQTEYISPFRRILGLMSKAPLLLRSSPGFGTGSYGAVPIGASTENSDDEDTDDGRRPVKRKKASGLRNAMSSTTLGTESSGSTRRRQSNARRRPSAEVEDVAEDIGLDSRFSSGGIPIPNAEQSSDPDSTDDTSEEAIDDTLNEEDPPDNSPYPQVRASVSAVDNTTLSINTPRMWTLSTIFSILGSSSNLFFSLRYPSVSITPVIALLLTHPLGLLWDRLLKRVDDPDEEFIDGVISRTPSNDTTNYDSHEIHRKGAGSKARRLRLWLAQGRWNEKEHSCVYISSNVSFGFAFATDVIVEQTQFYNQKVSITYQLLLILSTQILGYTFAGLTRRFLVRPGGMIWPGTLMSAAMFTTLHKEENTVANGWKITRWKFFFVVWLSSFLFYFLPGLLAPALSYFNVITWFAPDNVIVANLFGVSSGLGLFPVTFDWAQIAYIGSPLLTPFWAAMNVVGGLVIVMWIIAPIAYYTNVFFSSYMPILSSAVFDNRGDIYDVSKILTPEFLFDREAYQNYSRVFLPITYVLSYGLQFAALASLLTHTACWHGKDIWKQWRRSLKEVEGETKTTYKPLSNGASSSNGNGRLRLQRSDSHMENIISQEDVHNRLMRRYKDAPLSWYLLTFVSMTAVGIFVVEYYPVHLPWYGLLLALGICSILFIPIGIVMAITNQHSSIYLICQLVCGAVFPGRPVANMVFVTYGYISSAQGIKFSSDLKLGHYMKIPPRILFSVQMVATIISSVTQIAVLNWMFANVPNICTPQAVNGFVCPIARVHFNGSILWGVVGPGEFFGKNATYHILVWCFPIGAIAPIILWLYARNKKGNIIRKINLPVLFGSLSWIPPATGLNFSVWALVCYLFNYQIKNRATAWWAKYTMTLSAALDSGLAFGLVVVFFGFVYPGWMEGFKWWGTEIFKRGCDWNACPYMTVENGSHFGPDTW